MLTFLKKFWKSVFTKNLIYVFSLVGLFMIFLEKIGFVIVPSIILAKLFLTFFLVHSLFQIKNIIQKIGGLFRLNRGFALLLTAYTAFSLFLPILFIGTTYGSPLIYDDSSLEKKGLHYPQTDSRQIIFGEYYSKINNLGTVRLHFLPSLNGAAYGETKIAFTLSEQEGEPIYEGIHTLQWSEQMPFAYSFGFPVQEKSEGKNYLITIMGVDENFDFLQPGRSSNNKLAIEGRYVIHSNSVFSKIDDIAHLTTIKYQRAFAEQLPLFIFLFSTITGFLIWFWKKNKSPLQLTKALLVLTALLLAIIQTSGLLSNNSENFLYFSQLSLWYLNIVFFISMIYLLWFARKDIRLMSSTSYVAKQSSGVIFMSLFLIVCVQIAVKLPNLSSSFAHEIWGTKYLLHADSAKYMYEQMNPFLNRQRYKIDPVHNPDGLYPAFGTLPLEEWAILGSLFIFPTNSLEINTHVAFLTLGIFSLLLAYYFLTHWFTSKQSLIITFLFSINPIFNLTYFYPNEDSWLMIFTFISLIAISKYVKQKHHHLLYIAALFLGLGNVNKLSIFLWLFPIICSFLAFNSKRLSTFLRDSSLVVITSLTVMIAYRASLMSLPSNPGNSILNFLFWVVIFYLFFYLTKRYLLKIDEIINIILKRKLVLFFVLLLILFLIIAFFRITGVGKFSNAFLTNKYLIFNLDMYWFMFTNQFKSYVTTPIFIFSIIGVIAIPFLLSGNQKKVVISIALGAIVYWVLASQAIWIHDYYTNIIMFFFTISAGLFIYLLSLNYKTTLLRSLLLTSIFLMVFPQTYNINSQLGKTSHAAQIKDVANFLKENSEENEIFIDERWGLGQLSLLSNRKQASLESFLQDELIQDAHEMGVLSVIHKYNISYIVVNSRSEPDYPRYLSLFIPQEIYKVDSIDSEQEGIHERTKRILSATGKPFLETNVQSQSQEELWRLISEYNIVDKFKLVKDFGHLKIYEFSE